MTVALSAAALLGGGAAVPGVDVLGCPPMLLPFGALILDTVRRRSEDGAAIADLVG